jgi:hypothetical protein
VQLDLLARTQRHPTAVRTSREQQNPDLNDLRVLKSQAERSLHKSAEIPEGTLTNR